MNCTLAEYLHRFKRNSGVGRVETHSWAESFSSICRFQTTLNFCTRKWQCVPVFVVMRPNVFTSCPFPVNRLACVKKTRMLSSTSDISLTRFTTKHHWALSTFVLAATLAQDDSLRRNGVRGCLSPFLRDFPPWNRQRSVSYYGCGLHSTNSYQYEMNRPWSVKS